MKALSLLLLSMVALVACGPATTLKCTPCDSSDQCLATETCRRGYCVQPAPEAEVTAPSSGLPAWLVGRAPTEVESEAGWPSFAVIATTIDRFDWLQLDDVRGHRRAQFSWWVDRYTGRWVIP